MITTRDQVADITSLKLMAEYVDTAPAFKGQIVSIVMYDNKSNIIGRVEKTRLGATSYALAAG